jgi:hypothetical protein
MSAPVTTRVRVSKGAGVAAKATFISALARWSGYLRQPRQRHLSQEQVLPPKGPTRRPPRGPRHSPIRSSLPRIICSPKGLGTAIWNRHTSIRSTKPVLRPGGPPAGSSAQGSVCFARAGRPPKADHTESTLTRCALKASVRLEISPGFNPAQPFCQVFPSWPHWGRCAPHEYGA